MIVNTHNLANMESSASVVVDKRVFLSGLLLLILMVSFWSLSRYPALDLKAAMSDTLGVTGGLSFESRYDLDSVKNVIEKIGYTLLNWIHVNERGMLFGLALSTVLLVLLPLIVTRLPQGKFSAILSGLMLGIPMGLCVNCAAPIAFSLYNKNVRAEMALVTMLSSPQLNIIVLMMAFSLFPAYLVFIKIICSLVLIFLVVPAIVQKFSDESPKFESTQTENQQCEIPRSYNWVQASMWLAKSLCTQALWLLKNVLPLMLLAGVIGATLITLVPWQQVIELLPTTNGNVLIVAIIALAIFSLILPVPITFDIILAAVLFANDVPIVYIAILLFTLGSFSIYSWFVLVKAGAVKTANSLAVSILVLGVIAGIGSDYYETNFVKNETINAYSQIVNLSNERKPLATQNKSNERAQQKHNKQQDILEAKKQFLIENKEQYSAREFAAIKNLNTVKQSRDVPKRIKQLSPPMAMNNTVEWQQWPGSEQIHYLELSNKKSAIKTSNNLNNNSLNFTYQTAQTMGFEYHQKPLYEQFVVPFIQMNSLSSGDFNNDGWIDIAVGTYTGVYLYENIGGTYQLSSQNTAFEFDANIVGAVALQDMNNDGWLDLIWSSNELGGFVAYNQQGEFNHIVALPVDKRIAFAVAFDDVNNDGMLDILWGQYFNEWLYNTKNQNVLLVQQEGQFVEQRLPGPPGSALTALFSDINGDGNRELMIGNEFDQADIHYRSVLNQDFQSWNSYWPAVPHSTMSIVSADIDNDLILESYHAQITHNPSSGELRVPLIKKQDYFDKHCNKNDSQMCSELEQQVKTVSANRRKMASDCLGIEGNAKYECLALLLTKPNLRDSYEAVQVQERTQLCSLLSSYSLELENHCVHKLNIIAKRKSDELQQLKQAEQGTESLRAIETGKHIKQVGRVNLLYQHHNPKKAKEVAKQYGIDITGWAWNAKFADLDGDSWQDLFVVNGYSEQQAMTSNAWYRNINGKKFDQQAAAVGLEFFKDMLSYLYIDVDNDGDLDIIGFDIQGHLHTWINNESKHNHVQIELRDVINNINGIGAKIVIRYGDKNQLQQLREVKASGGFLSMDAAIVHFGVKGSNQIGNIEVITSDNVRHTFEGPFETNRRYRFSLK